MGLKLRMRHFNERSLILITELLIIFIAVYFALFVGNCIKLYKLQKIEKRLNAIRTELQLKRFIK